jgi:hypothetical protein
VWAAGYDTPPGASGLQTLFWATVPSLHPGGGSPLWSVSAVPGAATAWAAGDSLSGPFVLQNGQGEFPECPHRNRERGEPG